MYLQINVSVQLANAYECVGSYTCRFRAGGGGGGWGVGEGRAWVTVSDH